MRRDLLAGVTTAAVVLPQAMAYATIAGLPVEVGLYTAVVPLLVYALLGTSRALSVSTTSTLAALTGAAIASVPPEQAMATTTLAMLTGGLLLLAGLFKLGFLADFISHPVLAGFKAGTGLLIASGQLGKVLGIEQTGDSFFAKLRSAIQNLDAISWPTAALAAATIAGLYALKRTNIPGSLVAVGAGIVVGATGVLAVALTGDVPGGLPAPAAPDLSLIGPLLPTAAGIALMSFVESVAAGRAITHEGEAEPDADRELVALGAANFAGGLFRAMPSGGGLSQTAVNDAALTKRAGAVTGAAGVLTLLLLTDLLADLPQATLGALVLVSALGLVQLEPLRRIGHIHRRGVVLGLLTMLGVLTLGVLQGVLIGVLASMLLLLHALDHPLIDRTEDGAIRVHGPLYFANVQRVRRRIFELDPDPVLDMSAVTGVDVTAAQILADLTPRMRGLDARTARVMRIVSPTLGDDEPARGGR